MCCSQNRCLCSWLMVISALLRCSSRCFGIALKSRLGPLWSSSATVFQFLFVNLCIFLFVSSSLLMPCIAMSIILTCFSLFWTTVMSAILCGRCLSVCRQTTFPTLWSHQFWAASSLYFFTCVPVYHCCYLVIPLLVVCAIFLQLVIRLISCLCGYWIQIKGFGTDHFKQAKLSVIGLLRFPRAVSKAITPFSPSRHRSGIVSINTELQWWVIWFLCPLLVRQAVDLFLASFTFGFCPTFQHW